MISVVDDDPSVCRALKRLLRSFGFEVETFSSEQDFFSSPHQKRECVILDIHLGGTSGFEIHQRLKQEGDKYPVIFITAHDDEQTRLQVHESGAAGYLQKPFEDEELIEAIRRALARQV